MSSSFATWEDEDNNRQIRFRMDYAFGNSDIEIVEIVPCHVTFVATSQSVGVHTSKGRKHLTQKLLESGRIESLKNEIAEGKDLVAAV
jgi:hypothetical protein